MAKTPHTPPAYGGKAFHCPLCNAYSTHIWYSLGYHQHSYLNYEELKLWELCICQHCTQHTLWHNKILTWPDVAGTVLPNDDLPDDIKKDYKEARSILNKSPRGAAALLRLCIQKLCKHLGESGKDINDDIANLVKKGLPIEVQQALDVVRVVGNNAVHPGEMDIKDDFEAANSLFDLVNFIAERMITQPKQVDTFFNKLPASKQEAIKKRDNPT